MITKYSEFVRLSFYLISNFWDFKFSLGNLNKCEVKLNYLLTYKSEIDYLILIKEW
jgi:hypothetical protein